MIFTKCYSVLYRSGQVWNKIRSNCNFILVFMMQTSNVCVFCLIKFLIKLQIWLKYCWHVKWFFRVIICWFEWSWMFYITNGLLTCICYQWNYSVKLCYLSSANTSLLWYAILRLSTFLITFILMCLDCSNIISERIVVDLCVSKCPCAVEW